MEQQHIEPLWTDDRIYSYVDEVKFTVLHSERIKDVVTNADAEALAMDIRNDYEALHAQAQPPQQLDENGLLPCPFCGSVPYTRYGNGWFEVLCGNENDDCAFAPYVSVDTRENAIAAWNRRAQPPAPQPVPDEEVREAIVTLLGVAVAYATSPDYDQIKETVKRWLAQQPAAQ